MSIAPRRPRPGGFSLIEMLATVAALVIVLGLMVSLARYVRRQASDQFTKQLLSQLDVVMQRYYGRYQAVPAVPAFIRTTEAKANDTLPKESVLQEAASVNNRAIVAALQVEARRYPAEFADLPQSFFVGDTLPDAWGTPIVFMPALHPAVGMAMKDAPFFLSAGPDLKFHTIEDNLYSYEEGNADNDP
jgi:prepilin-type N-terminal cleavage/methylation domain-containing protein